MDFRYANKTGREPDADVYAAMRAAAEAALEYERVEKNCSVSLCLVTDAEISALNERYRRRSGPTDVLSFPQYESRDEINAQTEPVILGDIVISLDTAEAQAREYGHGLRRELAFLTLHSALHLLGYDHTTPEGEEEMTAKQEEILSALGINRNSDGERL